MKEISKWALVFALTLLFISPSLAKDTKAFQVYTSGGKSVDFKKVIKASAEKKYVFFGEFHNNPISHWLQFELLREMHAYHRNKLVLGAEMFEADNQYILDEYLQGLISSKNFQNEVRLWPNYNTDYKPLVEYAKKNKLPFIATNIPRRYANMVYKKGLPSLDSLSDLAKSYIVPLDEFKFDSTVACYKELIASMGGHGGVEIAKAQAIKDATMAHFILKNTASRNVFLHFNGAYHSDNYQGIVYYLTQKIDSDKVLTITTVEQKRIDKLKEANKDLADYIICVPESMTKTH